MRTDDSAGSVPPVDPITPAPHAGRRLRRAVASDARDVAALVDAAYRPWVERIGMIPGPMTADYDSVIRNQEVTVAELDGVLEGLLVLGITDEGFVIDNVAVHPSLRGTGLGRALLELAETSAQQQGFDSLYLYTHEKMAENVALYSRIGYVEYERRSMGDFSLVFMRKRLLPGGTGLHHDSTQRGETREPAICCPIVELRRYTLHPGQRDVLIELFDREFVETQEAVGIRVVGQFRDLDDPDAFVWVRGFADMPSRADALASFYGGPTWYEHRNAANATMIDSDDVRLMRPARPTTGFAIDDVRRPGPGAIHLPTRLVVANLYTLNQPADAGFTRLFEQDIAPILRATGASVDAYFVTESSTNTYPALPVRHGEHVFAWFANFADQRAYQAHLRARALSGRWCRRSEEAIASAEAWRLSPTSRSLVGRDGLGY